MLPLVVHSLVHHAIQPDVHCSVLWSTHRIRRQYHQQKMFSKSFPVVLQGHRVSSRSTTCLTSATVSDGNIVLYSGPFCRAGASTCRAVLSASETSICGTAVNSQRCYLVGREMSGMRNLRVVGLESLKGVSTPKGHLNVMQIRTYMYS